MKKESKKLKKYIETANNILVLTHLDPDGDAITSSLITSYIIRNYFKKNTAIILNKTFKRSSLKTFDWGEEYKQVQFVEYNDIVDLSKYDLIIMTDIAEIEKCFKNSVPPKISTPLISLDHHVHINNHIDNLSLSINYKLSSAAEQVYTTFYELLPDKLKQNKYLASLTQIGILLDTGNFLYSTTQPSTFKLMSILRKINPIPLETTMLHMDTITYNSTKVIEELLNNLNKQDDFCYTFLSRQFILNNNLTQNNRKDGIMKFMNGILKKLDGINWGFIIKESLDNKNHFHASFRSKQNTKDVSKIAISLGGGGHYSSSGANIKANRIENAVNLVIRSSAKVNI